MSEKKPILNIKDDIQSIVISVDKLQQNIDDLRNINKEMLYKIQQLIDYRETIIVKKPYTGWFY